MQADAKKCPKCGTDLVTTGWVGAGARHEYGPRPEVRPVYSCPNCSMTLEGIHEEILDQRVVEVLIAEATKAGNSRIGLTAKQILDELPDLSPDALDEVVDRLVAVGRAMKPFPSTLWLTPAGYEYGGIDVAGLGQKVLEAIRHVGPGERIEAARVASTSGLPEWQVWLAVDFLTREGHVVQRTFGTFEKTM